MSEPIVGDPSADDRESYDGAAFFAGLAGDADSESDLAWIDDDRTPEERRNSTFLDVYINSWEETLLPDEQAEFKVWLAGLEPAERERLDATRAEIAQMQLDHETRTTSVEAQLRATAPELFTGRLPMSWQAVLIVRTCLVLISPVRPIRRHKRLST